MYKTKLQLTLATVLAIGIAGFGAGALGNLGFADTPGLVAADSPNVAQGAPGAGDPRNNRRPEPETPAQAAARRAKSQNNLKMIALAMHNFHDVKGHFPPPAIYGKDGKPLLSWRVAILPYLDQNNLYKRFKLDEPWDSAHNKRLIQEMPTVFAPVGGLYKEPDRTYYQVFVGKGAAFEAGKGIRIPDFTDGTSYTILVVEAGMPVLWTKPQDLPFVPNQALPKLGGLFQGDLNAAFADGSVRWLTKKTDPDMLRAAITRNGGEIIDFDRLNGTPPLARPKKGEANRLPEENAQLREALEVTVQELQQTKDEVKNLKDLLAKENDAGNARAVQMRKENAAIRQRLEASRSELEAVRKEKARLEKELEKRRKDQ